MGEHILTVPPLSPHTLLTFTGIVLVFYLDTLTSSRAVQGLLWSLINLLLLLPEYLRYLILPMWSQTPHSMASI